jgi:hypothetical protein
MNKLLFPKFSGQRYYDMHYRFFENLAKAAGVEVERVSGFKNYGADFQVMYRGKSILIDFYDFSELAAHAPEFDAVFKFHYYGHYPANVFPFMPISFYNWTQYESLSKQIKYQAIGDMVLNNQTPAGGARNRRRNVRVNLMQNWHKLDFAITEPVRFWEKINNCLVSVCVPGARGDILDRGQLQYWAFGACTISPQINIVLPHCITPCPDHCYVQCAPDFSDVIDKIRWCANHRESCMRIGENAKKIFQSYCMPKPAWAWIDKCLESLK